MVSEETLQKYSETVFADLPCTVEATRNRNNGKMLLLVHLSETEIHPLSMDENTLNSDMEAQVRELRDKLFPVAEATPEQVAADAEPAVEAPADVPPTDPAPPPSSAAPEPESPELPEEAEPEPDSEVTRP